MLPHFRFFRGAAFFAVLALTLSFARADDDCREGVGPGAVYTVDNAADSNHVLLFSRDASGALVAAGTLATGGKGTGASLGNQGALALSHDGRWLLAVNAASNTVSVFAVHDRGLVLSDVAPSGGVRPVSVTIADNLVYVLNAGGSAGAADNISGLYLTRWGKLLPLPGSTQPLSAASTAPAQISFGLRGDVLVVTEKTSNRVDTFAVDDSGRAGLVHPNASAGAVPFGFATSRAGCAFVSEAPGSGLSSYRLHENGALSLVTASLANHQTAACWVVLSKDERFAYTANAGSNSISAYRIAGDGSVTLADSTRLTATTDAHPVDMAVSGDGRYLHSLDTGAGTIVTFRTASNGTLTRLSSISGLPATVTGLIAR